MAIIIDYSAISTAAILVNRGDVSLSELNDGAFRHLILNSLRAITKNFRALFGKEVIIACDAKGSYWRDEVYPYYKWKRRQKKKDDKINWELIYRVSGLVIEELRQVFPYKVVRVDRAEADDVIATLVRFKATQIAEPADSTGFGFVQPVAEPVLIVSGDEDFLQLHRFPSVKQYKNTAKDYLTTEDPELALKTKIIKGDDGDGIPNILSADDIFTTGGRQSPMTAKRLAEFIATQPSELEKLPNFVRNRRLIDFDHIPPDVQAAVLAAYNAAVPAPRKNILPYLISNQLQNLIGNLSDF